MAATRAQLLYTEPLSAPLATTRFVFLRDNSRPFCLIRFNWSEICFNSFMLSIFMSTQTINWRRTEERFRYLVSGGGMLATRYVHRSGGRCEHVTALSWRRVNKRPRAGRGDSHDVSQPRANRSMSAGSGVAMDRRLGPQPMAINDRHWIPLYRIITRMPAPRLKCPGAAAIEAVTHRAADWRLIDWHIAECWQDGLAVWRGP